MRPIAALVALGVLAACGSPPYPLTWLPAGARGAPLAETLVVTMPHDDRYASERVGETQITRFAFFSITGAWGHTRGNSVTSDLDFGAGDGPFETRSVAGGVGNLLFKAFSQDIQSVIAARRPLTWRCAGPCVPAPESVVSVASELHARHVLAIRIVHLYSVRYGEREVSVTRSETRHGNTITEKTTTLTIDRSATEIGNCALELSWFEVQGGQIVHTTRWSSMTWFTGNPGDSARQIAATAAGYTVDDARRHRPSPEVARDAARPATAPQPAATPATPAPAERSPKPVRPPPRERPAAPRQRRERPP